MNKKHVHVMYHGNCPDGFGAALAAWTKYGDSAAYTPVYHNQTVPDVQSDAVVMIDFCYPLAEMKNLHSKVKHLTVLDHHEGAMQTLKELKSLPNTDITADIKHSGAVLAWKHMYPGTDVPLLLQYIEDRDCHFNKMPDAKVALLWLDTHPFEFGLWNAFLKFNQEVWHKIIDTNGSMLKKYKSMIRKAASQSVETRLSDYPAAFCFATEEIASDIATELSQRVNGIGMALVLQSDGSIKVSLRANEGLNMIPIAQALGGNGHAYAAAFKCTPDKLRDLLAGKDLLAPPEFGFGI